MYKIYLGDVPLKTKVCKSSGLSLIVSSLLIDKRSFHQAGNVKQELKHEPVSTRVKLKILPHLLRSRLAAECFPANIQVRSFSVLAGKMKMLSVNVRLIVVVNLPVDEEFTCAVVTFPFLNRSYMTVCSEQTPTINFCRSRCSLSITSVWCKEFFILSAGIFLLVMFVYAFF